MGAELTRSWPLLLVQMVGKERIVLGGHPVNEHAEWVSAPSCQN